MAVEQELIENLLRAKFPSAKIVLKDLVGDKNHYQLEFSDDSINTLSRVKQHQAIYDALGSIVGNELHALKILII